MVFTLDYPNGRNDLVKVLYKENFKNTISNLLKNKKPSSRQFCQKWIDSPFVPLKNIADSTLQLFKNGDLPNIKSIKDGDIKYALEEINNIINSNGKNIIFISGAPGAGKTLVGLKTVYDHIEIEKDINPIYLSGNDPLITILQNTLTNLYHYDYKMDIVITGGEPLLYWNKKEFQKLLKHY
ncbi:MAG: DUF2075 domain-containing protein, partial [Arcobacter sp.]|nr:DUF2075 domain-containing protein [Arcobacter sp.]